MAPDPAAVDRALQAVLDLTALVLAAPAPDARLLRALDLARKRYEVESNAWAAAVVTRRSHHG